MGREGEGIAGQSPARIGPNMSDPLMVAKAPCKSCPYRQDVPSGLWHEHEYDKLPAYDGDIPEQLAKGAWGMFDCHQRDGHLCAGWIATHGAGNLLAMRLGTWPVAPEVWAYQSPVPVFTSGQEACAHGKRDIERPKARALAMIGRLMRKAAR
jgi:hypothetical protein